MYFYRGCSESVLRVLYSAALMTLHYDCEQRYYYNYSITHHKSFHKHTFSQHHIHRYWS